MRSDSDYPPPAPPERAALLVEEAARRPGTHHGGYTAGRRHGQGGDNYFPFRSRLVTVDENLKMRQRNQTLLPGPDIGHDILVSLLSVVTTEHVHAACTMHEKTTTA